ncbi:hypothetical protein BDD43_5707 [Mucilaginibacter gracilis]|uniref:Uncharacterized protein n=1 Tax=Mucilaginibacter gracilis TaxID=423350 RepID=A0A495J8V0_9SPHI|nr:hypothetical protein BDD43_5707 [Mucilaginibacter gracilis]
MWAHRKLIVIFYRPLFIANIAFNFIALLFIHIFGWGLALNALFIKAAGYAILVGYQYTLYNKTYFYYRNSGVPIRKMYGYTFLLDFLVFALATLIYWIAAK